MIKRTGGRILVDNLVAQGCDRIFTVPGESFLAVLDALHDTPAIDLVVCRQEGGVGFMAAVDGTMMRRPGVAFVTRGPGAANAAIAPPKQISVTFNEKLVPAFSKIDVAMAGMNMHVPVKTAVSADGKTLVAVPQGGFMKGSYVINWSAASADGHKTKGAIPFKIK